MAAGTQVLIRISVKMLSLYHNLHDSSNNRYIIYIIKNVIQMYKLQSSECSSDISFQQ